MQQSPPSTVNNKAHSQWDLVSQWNLFTSLSRYTRYGQVIKAGGVNCFYTNSLENPTTSTKVNWNQQQPVEIRLKTCWRSRLVQCQFLKMTNWQPRSFNLLHLPLLQSWYELQGLDNYWDIYHWSKVSRLVTNARKEGVTCPTPRHFVNVLIFRVKGDISV